MKSTSRTPGWPARWPVFPRLPQPCTLVLSDPPFRGICEEYALAQQSLARFEGRADAAERPEVGDYRRLIAELEAEIGGFLQAAARRR